MNIFAYDPCPKTCALWLDDIRKNKMTLETAQLLSTTIRINDPVNTSPVYKVTHRNHPSAQWARKSRANYEWLLDHWCWMIRQRITHHKSSELYPHFKKYLDTGQFPFEERTPFSNNARNVDLGLDFTQVEDTHAAYRMYTSERWRLDTIKLTWHWGMKPEWSSEGV